MAANDIIDTVHHCLVLASIFLCEFLVAPRLSSTIITHRIHKMKSAWSCNVL
jgi:hypothetical protein